MRADDQGLWPALEIEPDDSRLQTRVEPSEDGDYVDDDEEETNSYLSGSYYDGSNDVKPAFGYSATTTYVFKRPRTGVTAIFSFMSLQP